MQIVKKPSRQDLLKVVTRLQLLIGQAEAYHANDRNPDGFERRWVCGGGGFGRRSGLAKAGQHFLADGQWHPLGIGQPLNPGER